MAESLIELLPEIVREGKREVARIMERLQGDKKLLLQTNEYVLPVRKEENLFRRRFQSMDGQNWFNLSRSKKLRLFRSFRKCYNAFCRLSETRCV